MGVDAIIRTEANGQSLRRPPMSKLHDVFEARWAEVKPFYKVNDFLTCVACEKKGHARKTAQRVSVFFDGPSIWAVCLKCKARGRVDVR